MPCKNRAARARIENLEKATRKTAVRGGSALEHFAAVLQRAQHVTIAAERARECGRKRPKHYLGNSGRNQRRYHQKRRQLAARGFLLVEDWFKKPSGNTALDEPRRNHPDTCDSEVDTDGRPEGQSDGDGNRAGRGGPGGEYLLPTEEEESGSEVESSRSGQAGNILSRKRKNLSQKLSRRGVARQIQGKRHPMRFGVQMRVMINGFTVSGKLTQCLRICRREKYLRTTQRRHRVTGH